MFSQRGSLTLPIAHSFESSNSNPNTFYDFSQPKRRGWGDYSSQEKCLYISLLLITLIALAFIAGVAVLASQRGGDDEDVGIPTKAPNVTILPPWLTTTSTTTTESTTTTTTPAPGWNTCFSKECTVAAGNILRSMSRRPEIGPCDDFYEYACGGFIEQNPGSKLDSDSLTATTVLKDTLSKQIKTILESEMDEEVEPQWFSQQFYHACIHLEKSEDFTQLTTLTDSLLSGTDLTKVLGRMQRFLGTNFLFTTSVDSDEMATEKNIIHIDQPTFGLGREYLVDDTHSYFKTYTDFIKDVWKAVLPFDPNYETVARTIVGFEKKLAEISTAAENRLNKMAMYNPRSIAQLYEFGTEDGYHIEWVSFWTELYDEQIPVPPTTESPTTENSVTEEPIDPPNWNATTVIVRDLEYFSQLKTVLKEVGVGEQDIRNYLKWRIFLTLGGETESVNLQELFKNFYQQTQQDVVVDRTWQGCVDKTNSYLGMAVGYYYAQKHFNEKHKAAVQVMVDDIKDAFKINLLQLDWISAATVAVATEKINKLTTLIAYPDWLYAYFSDPTLKYSILDYYEDLTLSTPTDHFQNIVDLLKWRSERELFQLWEPPIPKRWTKDPISIETYYSAVQNALTVPAAFAQLPLYGAPLQYLNYATLGTRIAHELTHGFDAEGSENDFAGNLDNWWDVDTSSKYSEKSQCFVDQYDGYESPETNLYINGTQTLRENIADNGGLSLALQAYRLFANRGMPEKVLTGFDEVAFTPEKLFYLTYAQSFCSVYKNEKEYLTKEIETSAQSPARFRVQGVLENSVDFASAWGCPAANVTCRIW